MFDMAMPWWEFIVRGATVYLVLLILVRISGKRTVGQFTPFDLLVVMLLSESVSNSLSGEDNSVIGGLIIASTLIALNLTMGFISSRSETLEKVLEGVPVLLGRNGKIFEEALLKHRIAKREMEEALRKGGCELADLDYAVLETDGQITVQKKQQG